LIDNKEPHPTGSPESTWIKLANLANPAALPANALLGFDIADPRLHHPPRNVVNSTSATAGDELLELLKLGHLTQHRIHPAYLTAQPALLLPVAFRARKPSIVVKALLSQVHIQTLYQTTQNPHSASGHHGQRRSEVKEAGHFFFLGSVLPVWYC
jgi:hypothetical protein